MNNSGTSCVMQDPKLLDRAHGILLGQLAGDNLGALVEHQDPEAIAAEALEELRDGGYWNLLAGQPSDDGELALSLARSLVQQGRYDVEDVLSRYVYWYQSEPFDVGSTIDWVLSAGTYVNHPTRRVRACQQAAEEQSSKRSNGALMRISPLALWGYRVNADDLIRCARLDASLTHAHPACLDANVVFVLAIVELLRGNSPDWAYQQTLDWAKTEGDASIFKALSMAEDNLPRDYVTHMGDVLIALQNAFYWLLYAKSPAEAIRDTIRRGGDTDTNAAIAGALLGAYHGGSAFPEQWRHTLRTCRPSTKSAGAKVMHPRPEVFWPVDFERLAERLLIA